MFQKIKDFCWVAHQVLLLACEKEEPKATIKRKIAASCRVIPPDEKIIFEFTVPPDARAPKPRVTLKPPVSVPPPKDDDWPTWKD